MDGTELDGLGHRTVWCNEDEDFWHEDGDVILVIGTTALRVHGQRLAGYCGYFHELLGHEKPETQGCRAYLVTLELSLEDFKHLLKVIESPFDYAANPLSQPAALSLLAAASTLSCGYVLDLAKKRLCEIWDGRTPPTTDPSDSEDHSVPSAIRAIKVGRKYGIPGVLKRAFYELLSNPTLWCESEYSEPRQSAIIDQLSGIAEKDVHRLLSARLKLGRRWRKFVTEAPAGAWRVSDRGPCSTRRCCHAGDSKEAREGKWRNFVCERDLLDVADPVRYDLTKDLRIVDGVKAWCEGCLESKRRAWEVMRNEWWGEMDEWFGL